MLSDANLPMLNVTYIDAGKNRKIHFILIDNMKIILMIYLNNFNTNIDDEINDDLWIIII